MPLRHGWCVIQGMIEALPGHLHFHHHHAHRDCVQEVERCACPADRPPACEPCNDQVLRNRILALERKVDRLERMVQSPEEASNLQMTSQSPAINGDRKAYAVDPLALDALRGEDVSEVENVNEVEGHMRVTNLGTLLDVLA